VTGDLERRLAELATAIEVPPAPDPAAVLSRLPERRRRPARPTRRVAALAAAVALLAAGTALAVPSSRTTILRAFGLEGVRIEQTPTQEPIPPSTAAKLGLGARIPLARVRRAAGFTALETPRANAAYLAHDLPDGRITLVAGRALIFEFRGTVGPLLLKLIGPQTQHRLVRVNGGPGVYLSGAPHELLFLTANGAFRTVRIAGDVLVWQQGPRTLRIEGLHTLPQALALARTLH
jgi:hypothetical protein